MTGSRDLIAASATDGGWGSLTPQGSVHNLAAERCMSYSTSYTVTALLHLISR